MTSNPAQKKESAKKRVRFFNVSLRNGIVVSTPSYPEKQAFLAHLIRALEGVPTPTSPGSSSSSSGRTTAQPWSG